MSKDLMLIFGTICTALFVGVTGALLHVGTFYLFIYTGLDGTDAYIVSSLTSIFYILVISFSCLKSLVTSLLRR